MGCEELEKRLDFESDTFAEMKKDMNFVLQRLIGTMQEKQATEGSMTLKIDVTMIKEYVPNYDPKIKGESREVSKPQFKHKVTSNVKINDEKSGNLNSEMELFFDEETGNYALRPIVNTAQRNIFDTDFWNDEESEADEEVVDGTAKFLSGPTQDATGMGNLLPGPSENTSDAGESEVSKDQAEGEPEDITEEILQDTEDRKDDDDYGYEEPEDGEE